MLVLSSIRIAMNTYYKHYAESDWGEGTVYLEIKEGWVVRQVEVYGSKYLYGDDKHPDHLADQPFSVLGLGQQDEITKQEFEQIWMKATQGCQ